MPERSSSSGNVSIRLTISEDVEAYEALRLARNPTAETLLPILKDRLRTEPVNELDVQTIWWTFCTPEWFDALFYNIVKFNVFNSQPAGGYIELFIETEMLNYHERACNNIIARFERQVHAVVAEAATRDAARKAAPGHLHRVMSRMADKGVKLLQEACIRKMMFDYLRKI